jgi:hypothetical protein
MLNKLKNRLGIHIHTYTRWKTISRIRWNTHDGGVGALSHIVQERTCTGCGKVKMRTENV